MRRRQFSLTFKLLFNVSNTSIFNIRNNVHTPHHNGSMRWFLLLVRCYTDLSDLAELTCELYLN